MPANLKDLRTRIKSVKSTQQITKAMKLVSAAKFGRAQINVMQARPYSVALNALAGRLLGSFGDQAQAESHPLLKEANSNVVAVLVISSERGLCGGYNANLAKMAARTIEELEAQGKTVAVSCIGKKALQILSRRRVAGVAKLNIKTVDQNEYVSTPEALITPQSIVQIQGHFERPNFELAGKLALAFETLFGQEKIGKFVVVYSKFQSAMTQIPTVESMLPIEAPKVLEHTLVEPILEPSAELLIGAILPRYLATRIYQTLLEAVASEHGARMSAMDSATRNAKDMERRLQITYQRARQAAITNELIEIISGAEAL